MRLIWKWLIVAIGGGLLIMWLPTLTNSELLPSLPDWVPDFLLDILFWPIPLCLKLSGPGLNIGTPDKPFIEATPLQLFAIDAGVGISWMFYSSLAFLIFWIAQRHHSQVSTSNQNHARS